MPDGGPDPLAGWVADVTPDRVHALLLARAPSLLEPDSAEQDLFLEMVSGVASEVLPLVPATTVDPALRNLASWAVSLGVAAHLEAALFPEQQGLGDDSRSAQLLARYLGVLATLRGTPGALGIGAALPAGKFPPAPVPAWPDPALAAPRTGYRVIAWPEGVVPS